MNRISIIYVYIDIPVLILLLTSFFSCVSPYVSWLRCFLFTFFTCLGVVWIKLDYLIEIIDGEYIVSFTDCFFTKLSTYWFRGLKRMSKFPWFRRIQGWVESSTECSSHCLYAIWNIMNWWCWLVFIFYLTNILCTLYAILGWGLFAFIWESF